MYGVIRIIGAAAFAGRRQPGFRGAPSGFHSPSARPARDGHHGSRRACRRDLGNAGLLQGGVLMVEGLINRRYTAVADPASAQCFPPPHIALPVRHLLQRPRWGHIFLRRTIRTTRPGRAPANRGRGEASQMWSLSRQEIRRAHLTPAYTVTGVNRAAPGTGVRRLVEKSVAVKSTTYGTGSPIVR